MEKRHFWKFSFPAEKFQHTIAAKNQTKTTKQNEFGCTGEGKRDNLTFFTSLVPQDGGRAQCKARTS